jgi:hypothetical protein
MLQPTVQQLKYDNALSPSGFFARAELREQVIDARATALFAWMRVRARGASPGVPFRKTLCVEPQAAGFGAGPSGPPGPGAVMPCVACIGRAVECMRCTSAEGDGEGRGLRS